MTDWQVPDDMPSLARVHAVIELLRERLRESGFEPTVDPVLTNYQMNGLITALMRRGLVTADEVDYFAAVVELESLKRHEEESRPRPRIIVPGRDA